MFLFIIKITGFKEWCSANKTAVFVSRIFLVYFWKSGPFGSLYIFSLLSTFEKFFPAFCLCFAFKDVSYDEHMILYMNLFKTLICCLVLECFINHSFFQVQNSAFHRRESFYRLLIPQSHY